VQLSELVAALSFASDLGLGQPMEHVLRSCLISLRLADHLGLDEQQRAETYWVTLLALVCTGESSELAQMFGDDVAFRSGMYHVGPSLLAQMFYVLGQAGADRSAAARTRAAAGIALTGGKTVEARFLAHCSVTAQVSRQIGLPPRVGEALSHTFVRWDGKGVPRRIASEDVPMSVRLMQLADFAEAHHRLHGVEGAIGTVGLHAGKLPSPELVETFSAAAPEILRDLDETTWDRVIAAEPLPRPPLTEEELDSALEVIADIADLKSP
jgi:hypothetical protein